MKILRLTKESFPEILGKCLQLLNRPGKVLLIPTETVYGLVCDDRDEEAKNKILSMKERDPSKHFQILVDSLNMLEATGAEPSPMLNLLAGKFCPGPMTIVVPGKHGGSIGFRIPDHEFTLELIGRYGHGLAATSANISGEAPALNFEKALSALKAKPDLAIDGGEILSDGLASTVVDIREKDIKILREGRIKEGGIRDFVRTSLQNP